MDRPRKTKEQYHAELQQDFMTIVNKMIKSGCKLPNELELFYAVNLYSDRSGRNISAKPYLTKDMALEQCFEDSSSGGKWWHTSHDEVAYPTGECKNALHYKTEL